MTNFRLGYAGFRGNHEKWKAFAGDLFGLQPMDGPELLFRADEKAWRLRILDEEGAAVRFLGVELDDFDALDDLAIRLERAGHPASFDEDVAAARSVSRVLVTADPDGTPLEFYVGLMVANSPFQSPTGVTFTTGRAGLGHVLLSVSDIGRSLAFYRDLVGFRRSDILEMGGGMEGHFLNGGCRHHVVALAAVPDFVGLHHVFLEVDEISDVGRAWDRVQQADVPIVSRIGQHANDPALSFYVESPSGFAVEYGANSLKIDPATWTETRWDSPFIWGGGPVSR